MRLFKIAALFALTFAFGICILAALVNVTGQDFADALVWAFLAAAAAIGGVLLYRELDR